MLPHFWTKRAATPALPKISALSAIKIAVQEAPVTPVGAPMSFITELKGFAAWAEKELGKLSTEAPAIAKTVDTITQYVGGAASIIAGIEGGPAASVAVTAAVTAIHTGVTAVSGLVTDFGATPTAASIASSLATNATALLAAAKVTNPTSVSAATAIVSNLNSLATALTAASTQETPAS